MKQDDLTELRNEIARLAARSPIAGRVKTVHLEPSEDGDGPEFLRVTFELRDLPKLAFEEVEGLIKSIEEAVAQKDERYPSVRFADAA